MTTLLGQTQAIGTNALGTYQGIQRNIKGHPDLVSFQQPGTGSTLLQFDAVLNETHSRESPPTQFPLESGGSISDHILLAPFELQIQGVISDTPIGDKAGLITEAIATGLTAIYPALGVAAAGVGYGLYTASQTDAAGKKPATRSINQFHRLLALQAGDPTASPPVPPAPFDVVTRLRLYPSMVIKSLQVPRDANTGNAIVFQISLTQLVVVRPQLVTVEIVSNKALGAGKANEGEGQTRNGVSDGYDASQQDIDNAKKMVGYKK